MKRTRYTVLCGGVSNRVCVLSYQVDTCEQTWLAGTLLRALKSSSVYWETG